MPTVAQFIFRLSFGILAVLLGLVIIGWICYNQFIERLPQYPGFHWWEPLGIAPALIGIGVYWLRGLRIPDNGE